MSGSLRRSRHTRSASGTSTTTTIRIKASTAKEYEVRPPRPALHARSAWNLVSRYKVLSVTCKCLLPTRHRQASALRVNEAARHPHSLRLLQRRGSPPGRRFARSQADAPERVKTTIRRRHTVLTGHGGVSAIVPRVYNILTSGKGISLHGGNRFAPCPLSLSISG